MGQSLVLCAYIFNCFIWKWCRHSMHSIRLSLRNAASSFLWKFRARHHLHEIGKDKTFNGFPISVFSWCRCCVVTYFLYSTYWVEDPRISRNVAEIKSLNKLRTFSKEKFSLDFLHFDSMSNTYGCSNNETRKCCAVEKKKR